MGQKKRHRSVVLRVVSQNLLLFLPRSKEAKHRNRAKGKSVSLVPRRPRMRIFEGGKGVEGGERELRR